MHLTNADSVIHHTFVIERSYPVSPERVFNAFADPVRKRRWFGGKDYDEFQMDFQVGGVEYSSSRLGENTPFPGVALTNRATFEDIVPNRRVVTAATMTLGGKRISSALATFELVPNDKGTGLRFTHQAAFYEGADGPEMREAGWRTLLDRLDGELAG